MMNPHILTSSGIRGCFSNISTDDLTDSSTESKPHSQSSKSTSKYLHRSIASSDIPRDLMASSMSGPLICWAPQSVWPTTITSSTPSS